MRRALITLAACSLTVAMGCQRDDHPAEKKATPEPEPTPVAAEQADAGEAADADAYVFLPGRDILPKEQATRDQVRKLRLERRAFDGAPPFIPHPVDARTRDCLACHGQDTTVGGVKVPRMSHPKLLMCQQCHTKEEGGEFFEEFAEPGGPPTEESSWAGLVYGPGPRAFPGAPPAIPHPTLMRTRCASCHGDWGKKGLQTPHTDRPNCRQCHLETAPLDLIFANRQP